MAKQRLAFLDALRGLAAVYVVLYHVMAMPAPQVRPDAWLAALVAAGATGVALFFVISAFSLCYTMPRHRASGHPLASFYVHRLLRIAPLFYAWLAFSLWRDGRGAHAGHAWQEVLANLTFTFNLFDGWQEGIVWASWAIGVEMLFYAVFPLVFACVRTLGQALGVAVLGVAAAWMAAAGLFGDIGLALTGPFGLLRHLPVFAIGLCAYHGYRWLATQAPAAAQRTGTLSAFVGAALLLGCIVLSARGALTPLSFWLGCGIAYAVLLVGLSQRAPRWLVNRGTAWLGTISYSLYLGHPVVTAVLMPVFRRLQAHIAQPSLAYLACAVLTLAATLPLAWLTYRFVEAPAIAWSRRLFPRTLPAAQTA